MCNIEQMVDKVVWKENYGKSVSYLLALRPLLSSGLVFNIHWRGIQHVGNKSFSDFLNSVIANRFLNCQRVEYLANLNILFDNLNNLSQCINSPVVENLITDNIKIHSSSNSFIYNQLLALEALHIKFNKPELNSGLKASKELTLSIILFPHFFVYHLFYITHWSFLLINSRRTVVL